MKLRIIETPRDKRRTVEGLTLTITDGYIYEGIFNFDIPTPMPLCKAEWFNTDVGLTLMDVRRDLKKAIVEGTLGKVELVLGIHVHKQTAAVYTSLIEICKD